MDKSSQVSYSIFQSWIHSTWIFVSQCQTFIIIWITAANKNKFFRSRRYFAFSLYITAGMSTGIRIQRHTLGKQQLWRWVVLPLMHSAGQYMRSVHVVSTCSTLLHSHTNDGSVTACSLRSPCVLHECASMERWRPKVFKKHLCAFKQTCRKNIIGFTLV